MRHVFLFAAVLGAAACVSSCQEAARRDAEVGVPESLLLRPEIPDAQVARLPETGSPEAGLEPMQIRLDHSIESPPPPRPAPPPPAAKAKSPQPDRNRGNGGNNRNGNRDRDRWRRWAR
ncbi:MAG: hypothetical protein FJ288_00110 [Planctomycetes bacterium]|nr:hypothetical protein [Planctomycetota bacterium]